MNIHIHGKYSHPEPRKRKERGICPQCDSNNVQVEPYEIGSSLEAYHDCGVMITCSDCGAVSTEAEVEAYRTAVMR